MSTDTPRTGDEVAEHSQTTTAPRAVDVVKPLVDEAVEMYRDYLAACDDALARKVADPGRSPAVQRANARLSGACELLAKLWRMLGSDPAQMGVSMARRTVVRVYEQQQADPAVPTVGLVAVTRDLAEEDIKGDDFCTLRVDGRIIGSMFKIYGLWSSVYEADGEHDTQEALVNKMLKRSAYELAREGEIGQGGSDDALWRGLLVCVEPLLSADEFRALSAAQ